MKTNETNPLSLALEPGLDSPGSTDIPTTGDKRGIALLDKFDRALSKRISTKREQTEAAFKELFPRLLTHRLRGRTMKELLGAFNAVIPVNVCAKTFKLMFDAEAARHDQAGKFPRCPSCEQPWPGRMEQLANRQLGDTP